MRAAIYWMTIVCATAQFMPAVSSSADFHVRPANECTNDGDGTAAACAASPGAAGAFNGFASIDWSAIHPGDSLYVIGEHHTGLVVGNSGTAGRRITIRGDKAGAARGSIDGGGAVSFCLADNNHSYLSVLSLEVSHCLDRGLHFDNGRGVDTVLPGGAIVNNVFVHDIAGGSRYPTCIWGYGHDAIVDNSRVENCGDDGVWWTGNSVAVRNNSIAAVGIGPVETGDCIQLAGLSTQFNISRNRCDHLAANEKHCIVVSPPDGTVFDTTAGGRIEENTCFLPGYGGADTKGITVAQPNVLIARNFVNGGRIGIVANDPYIVGNVVTQFYYVGIVANGHPGWQALVANNTVVSVAGENGQVAPDFCMVGYETTGEFVNNIVAGCNVGMAGYGYTPNNVWDSNLSWQNSTTYRFGKPALNSIVNTLTSNPRFVGSDPRSSRAWSVVRAILGKDLSDYTEPNVGTPFVLDFLKNPRPTPPAVGAYEPGSR
ncbi:MAG TPA: hypothetical protein VIU34_36035 [Steroidobacter sp.]